VCTVVYDLVNKYPNSTIWIGGDLNLPDIDWSIGTVISHNYPVNLNELIIDTFSTAGLFQSVTFPTRLNNTLDIFASNRPDLVEKCVPIPGISDHEAIYGEIYLAAKIQIPTRRTIYLWHKADFTEIRQYITEFNLSFLNSFSTSSDVNLLWETVRDMCYRCLQMIPSKLSTGRYRKPWITTTTRRLVRKKQRLYNHARQTGSPRDWTRYYDCKRETQRECRRAHNDYVLKMVNSGQKTCSKQFWSYIKSQRNEQTGIPALQVDGRVYDDDLSKAESLNNYFSSVFTQEGNSPLPHLPDTDYPSIDPIEVSIEGVSMILQSLDPCKACGPDNIPTRFLKETAAELAPSLTLLYQASINQGIVPSEWKKAKVVPVYKKGGRSLVSNYRPISLTCVLCKTLEHIISSSIYGHLNRHKILCNEQHGFRQHRSCETQLVATINDLAVALNKGTQVDVILLDLAKAFDTVPHNRLVHKLSTYGINGHLLQWIKSFLMSRSQQVTVNGQLSSTTQVISGVPQGSVLGPLLFICYVNDMPEEIKSTLKLYADDALLYREIHSPEDSKILQEDINTLQKWAERWMMKFNPVKCEHLRVTNKSSPIVTQYFINGIKICQVPQAKYLGVHIDETLSWNSHVDFVCNKANNVRAFLQRNLRQCPLSVKERCYLSLVRPILEYACVVWSPYTQINIDKLEKVQRRAARFVCNDFSMYSSVTNMLNRMHWTTLETRRANLRLIMMFKIVNNLVEINAGTSLIRNNLPTRGHSNRFNQPFTRVNSFKYSFYPDAIKLWNKLPDDIINCGSLQRFKDLINI